ncbi:hypothetical protein GCM10009549_46190 [Streptomyces thermoalcalitolerans]|uniref:Uncharacterized protein n=1 Tax=Streptomyces thermoalcalitolerans TaxID=65605 RepID=A0ABN1PAM8_9ACTN
MLPGRAGRRADPSRIRLPGESVCTGRMTDLIITFPVRHRPGAEGMPRRCAGPPVADGATALGEVLP